MQDLHGRSFLPPEDRGGGGRVEVDVELLGVVDVVVVVVVESMCFRQIYQSLCLVVVVFFVFFLKFLILNVLYLGKNKSIYIYLVVVVVELLEVELLAFAALCSSPSTARPRCPAVGLDQLWTEWWKQ